MVFEIFNGFFYCGFILALGSTIADLRGSLFRSCLCATNIVFIEIFSSFFRVIFKDIIFSRLMLSCVVLPLLVKRDFIAFQNYLTAQRWSFPLRISSANLTKSASVVSCGFGHICWRNPWWKTSFFVCSVYYRFCCYFSKIRSFSIFGHVFAFLFRFYRPSFPRRSLKVFRFRSVHNLFIQFLGHKRNLVPPEVY